MCVWEHLTKAKMLVPNISLQQQEGCCCHSNCFQTWQLFLPSPTNPSPLPQLILCFDVYIFFPFSFLFFFYFGCTQRDGDRTHPPAACPWTTRGCCLHRHGASLMVIADLQPISPVSPGQNEALEQQILSAGSGKCSDLGGKLVCRECRNS